MTATSWDELIKNSAGSFDPLPNGDYDVVCVDAEASQTQNGKAMIKAKFKVQGGPHDGRHVWNNFTLSPENPNALSFFFQHMKVFGMDENFFAALPPVNADLGADDPSLQRIAATLMNRPARVTVKQRSWEGQQRNNVTAIKPSPGVPMGAAAPTAQAPSPGVPAAAPTPTPQAVPPTAQPAPQPAPAPAPQPPQAPAPAPAPAPAQPSAVEQPQQPPQPQAPQQWNNPSPEPVTSFGAENPWGGQQQPQSTSDSETPLAF